MICNKEYSEVMNEAIDYFEEIAREVDATDWEFIEADAPTGVVDIIFYFGNVKIFVSGAIRFIEKDGSCYELIDKEEIKRYIEEIKRNRKI